MRSRQERKQAEEKQDRRDWPALMKALPRGICWVEYFLTTDPAHCVASALARTIADFRAAAS
jgi:hypothetical protein